MKPLSFMFVFILFFACQPDPAPLKTQIQERIEQFEGSAGVYIRHLDRQESVEINADSLFPTASLIKIPILLALFDRIERDSLDYRQELVWHADSIAYAYDGGILSSFED